jgi:CRISPR-associated endoribonuclease Cas6
MKLSVALSFGKEVEIKIDRHHELFSSIIKECLNRSGDKEKIYSNWFRLFSFSWYLHDIKDNVFKGNRFTLNISTGDNNILTSFIIGFQKINKNNPYMIYDYPIHAEEVKIDYNLLETTECIFKVKNLLVKERNYNGYKVTSLLPNDNNYIELLKQSIMRRCNKMNIKVEYLDLCIIDYKIISRKLKNQMFKIIDCNLMVNSNVEVLNMIYNTGIGCNRGMGFGYVEVSK